MEGKKYENKTSRGIFLVRRWFAFHTAAFKTEKIGISVAIEVNQTVPRYLLPLRLQGVGGI